MLYILNHNCIVLQASHIDKYLYKLLTSPFLCIPTYVMKFLDFFFFPIKHPL